MKNIPLGQKQELTTYRKIAIASWRHPRDPSTYSTLTLPVEPALAYLAAQASDTNLSLTHFVTKIIAHCLNKYDELNHLLRASNLYSRKETDVFITTLLRTPKGKDLSGFVVRDVNTLSLMEVAKVFSTSAETLRKNEDKEMNQVQRSVDRTPSFLLKYILLLQEFIMYTLNLSLAGIGLPRDRFGSVMITNIGALGIDNALIPLSPYSRCPVIIGIGKVGDQPVVRDGEVVVGKCVTITMTFDHRYADGAHGAHVLRRFKKIFLSPADFPMVFEGKKTASDDST